MIKMLMGFRCGSDTINCNVTLDCSEKFDLRLVIDAFVRDVDYNMQRLPISSRIQLYTLLHEAATAYTCRPGLYVRVEFLC